MTITTLPPENAPVPGTYRHYKGQTYQVLGMARHSETEEWLVVYRALYADRGFWLRPLDIWLEPVSVPSTPSTYSNQPRSRFELIETAELSLADLTK